MRGGGGFLARVPPETDSAWIENLYSDLQRLLWNESGGEIHISLGWAETRLAARAQLEYRKRRPGNSLLQKDGRWNPAYWSRAPLDKPCDICGQFPGQETVQGEEEDVLHCSSCLKACKLGEKLTHWVKYGKLAPEFHSNAVFKRPQVMLEAGACFRTRCFPKPFYGSSISPERLLSENARESLEARGIRPVQAAFALAVPMIWRKETGR